MNNFYLINVYFVTIMLNTVLVSEDIGDMIFNLRKMGKH